MTYCCAILVDDGLAMVADTRTNAGLDNISVFRKLQRFEIPGERVLLIATSGNLSLTQYVLNDITRGLENPRTKESERLIETPSMYAAAELIGRAVRKARSEHCEAFRDARLDFDLQILFGGQINGGELRLFMIYPSGNFIEATRDTSYFQIGEHKYGKPVLDRAARFDMSLREALKLGLVSMDSTMRSNISVGFPIDVATIHRDALRLEIDQRIAHDEPWFRGVRESWSRALREAHSAIPDPPYRRGHEEGTVQEPGARRARDH
ncbi:MAG: peptidase [Hyphomicrobiales bacterium]|nr:peptidase [Hyphomicrobiales bacterium]